MPANVTRARTYSIKTITRDNRGRHYRDPAPTKPKAQHITATVRLAHAEMGQINAIERVSRGCAVTLDGSEDDFAKIREFCKAISLAIMDDLLALTHRKPYASADFDVRSHPWYFAGAICTRRRKDGSGST